MQRRRSLSFDDSAIDYTISETDEDALEKELSKKIAERKDRESKCGFIYIKDQSWLSGCCGLFPNRWHYRFARLSSDRLNLSSDDSNGPILSSINLKSSSVSLSTIQGHNGLHNCLTLTKSSSELILSLETSDNLKEWLLSLSYTIENLNKRSSYFHF